MSDTISDDRIESLISERKMLPPDWTQQFDRFKDRDDRYEAEVDFVGAAGTHFRIIARRSRVRMDSFSVILMAILPENPEFRLLRYDGSNHNHTNHVEDNRIVRQPHIHRATQRYQEAQRQLPHDGYAEPTDRYQDLPGAWECFSSDLNLRYPEGPQTLMLPMLFRRE